VAALPLAIVFAGVRGPSATVWTGALLIAPAVVAYGLAPALIQSMVPNQFRGQLVAIMKILEYAVVSTAVVAVGIISDLGKGTGGLSIAVASVALLLSAGAAASYLAAGRVGRANESA
jgi:hypothetical protein